MRQHPGEELAAIREEATRAWAIVDRLKAENEALEAEVARLREALRASLDRARSNHRRWEHEAEVLEECNRPLCLGARMLLWPDPDDPDFQPQPAPDPSVGTMTDDEWQEFSDAITPEPAP